jgi:glutamine---fructose-6-phosphate transaminase (isomerizing)
MKDECMSHLYAEIHEQPDAVRRLLAKEAEQIEAIAGTIRQFDPAFVVIAARGTSDNAARYAQYLLGIQAGLSVSLATPSVHTLYDAQPRLARALVIGISQSGHSADVRQVVEDAKAQGALTLSLTNYVDSPLAQTADHHICLQAGEEKSVAATKTYTTELVAIALLTQYIVQNDANIARIQQLPDDIRATLAQAAKMGDWVQRYRYMEHVAVIGRGYNYATAFEISLKIKELCYIIGEEYSEADFRHGPIAIISQGFPVIAVAPTGKTYPLMMDLLEQLHEKNAECIVISDDATARAQGIHAMTLPAQLPEWISPICAVLPGQLFAYHLAQAKGYDIDQPRGLNKVTVTR